MQEAADVERAAFSQWQHTYDSYDVARDEAATARRTGYKR
jgi:hypothetical protein